MREGRRIGILGAGILAASAILGGCQSDTKFHLPDSDGDGVPDITDKYNGYNDAQVNPYGDLDGDGIANAFDSLPTKWNIAPRIELKLQTKPNPTPIPAPQPNNGELEAAGRHLEVNSDNWTTNIFYNSTPNKPQY